MHVNMTFFYSYQAITALFQYHTCWQIQSHQCVYRLWCRKQNVNKSLVVLISNCSRESLYLCGALSIVITSLSVGNGTVPTL